ncbi:glycosyltransferase [Mitsuaria sp. WAJ17]|uniref:glycosyltransferase n=1 Tax=Mitsuaria sp. WAJ17 TaxID=2761452 RepID=UPI0015FFC291|nr:glycosyltransferase [Mitsuaria sp. WAJ17]MBB2487066.1 glycosyltransferase [Mitsuaria sp. WAJ17]
MSPSPPSVPDISVVIIGRNEGERLHRCLQSVRAARWQGLTYELIYVDSASTDGSLQHARQSGAQALLLDDPSPCAAKARNLGWQAALGHWILFLDGDTELDPDFAARAASCLRTEAALCAVWGHRRESNPGQSIYTRVLDLDWLYPAGRTPYFGGDVLVRHEALRQAGGFDPQLKAGEEPELCARLRAHGWLIEHIDAPMTRHDLAIRSFSAYCRRAYRSGIAYAEVAERMRQRQDPLWQREARRDFLHGLLYLSAPLWLGVAALLWPAALMPLLLSALLMIARSARRCAWKAPGQPGLCLQYAVHSHVQKVPALFGQLAWRRSHRQHRPLEAVDYKSAAAGVSRRQRTKSVLALLMQPLAGLWRDLVLAQLGRAWALARLRAHTQQPVCASNVLMGVVDVQGTGRIRLGRNALIYPGVCLETQGLGEIVLGDDVVLSRGVHVVAHARIEIGAGAMVGEYASLRDADHRRDPHCIRHSGHVSQAIVVERNVWVGRGAVVLKGVRLGQSCIVGANAVVTRDVPPHATVAGTPARPLPARRREAQDQPF